MQTLAEAKAYLRENFEKGCRCLACGQMVKLYRRKLTSSMAYGLCIIRKQKEVGEEFHLLDFFKEIKNVPAGIAGDLPKMRFWGLIEPKDDAKEDGNPNSGFYSLTTAGKLFADNQTKINKYLFLYNNKVQSRSDEMTTISECFKDKFNYEELMK